MTAPETTARRWSPGDNVVYRQRKDGRIWCEIPAAVIEDSGDAIAFVIRVGSTWLAPYDTLGERAHTWERDWICLPTRWHSDDCVYYMRNGDRVAYGLCVPRGEEGRPKLYANLQFPMRRENDGVEALDAELDLVRYLEQPSSQWKDLDRFDRLAAEYSMTLDERQSWLQTAREAAKEIESEQMESRLSKFWGMYLSQAGEKS